MTEQLKKEHITYSPEQLQEGVRLGPTETVQFNADTSGMLASRSFVDSNGIRHNGTAVALLRVGGRETFEDLMIITDSGTSESGKLLLTPIEEGVLARPLKVGEMQGVGRDVQGLEGMPDTVSGDHCAIGLDEEGRVVVENHEPTNQTILRVFNGQPGEAERG